MIVNIAGAYSGCSLRRRKPAQFKLAGNPGFRRFDTVDATGNIQQFNGNNGIGKLRCNTRPHGAGSDEPDFLYSGCLGTRDFCYQILHDVISVQSYIDEHRPILGQSFGQG